MIRPNRARPITDKNRSVNRVYQPVWCLRQRTSTTARHALPADAGRRGARRARTSARTSSGSRRGVSSIPGGCRLPFDLRAVQRTEGPPTLSYTRTMYARKAYVVCRLQTLRRSSVFCYSSSSRSIQTKWQPRWVIAVFVWFGEVSYAIYH
jgi:hypothetical protein